MELYTKYSKEKIKLSNKPFASGGDGSLYHISSPQSLKHLVAKIYHPHKQNATNEEKLNYLIQNAPTDIAKDSLAWATDLVYQEQKFVGILMPLLEGKTLTVLTLNLLSDRIGLQWNRFELGNQNAHKLRLRICLNLAKIIHRLHQSQRYVIVDLKPDNILVRPNGSVALIDMDSIEVVEKHKVLYPAYSATPEYSPPEYHQLQAQNRDRIALSWNRFSMSIIFYQLLLGIHPFAGSCQAPYQQMVSLSDKIKGGLFVHGKLFQQHLKTLPPPHKGFELLNYELQELFKLCFEQGHKAVVKRPTAQEWELVLTAVLDTSSKEIFFHISKKSGQLPSKQIKKKSLTTTTVGIQTTRREQQGKNIKPLLNKTLNVELNIYSEEFKTRIQASRILFGVITSIVLTATITTSITFGFLPSNLIFWLLNCCIFILSTTIYTLIDKQQFEKQRWEHNSVSLRKQMNKSSYDSNIQRALLRKIKDLRHSLNLQFKQLQKQKDQTARLLPLQQAVVNAQKQLLNDLKKFDTESIKLAEEEYLAHLKIRQNYLEFIKNDPFAKKLGVISYILVQSKLTEQPSRLVKLKNIFEHSEKKHITVQEDYAQKQDSLAKTIKKKSKHLKSLKKDLTACKTILSTSIKKQEQFDYDLQDNHLRLEKAYKDAQQIFKLNDYLKYKKPISTSQYLSAFWGRKTLIKILKDLKDKYSFTLF